MTNKLIPTEFLSVKQQVYLTIKDQSYKNSKETAARIANLLGRPVHHNTVIYAIDKLLKERRIARQCPFKIVTE